MKSWEPIREFDTSEVTDYPRVFGAFDPQDLRFKVAALELTDVEPLFAEATQLTSELIDFYAPLRMGQALERNQYDAADGYDDVQSIGFIEWLTYPEGDDPDLHRFAVEGDCGGAERMFFIWDGRKNEVPIRLYLGTYYLR